MISNYKMLIKQEDAKIDEALKMFDDTKKDYDIANTEWWNRSIYSNDEDIMRLRQNLDIKKRQYKEAKKAVEEIEQKSGKKLKQLILEHRTLTETRAFLRKRNQPKVDTNIKSDNDSEDIKLQKKNEIINKYYNAKIESQRDRIVDQGMQLLKLKKEMNMLIGSSEIPRAKYIRQKWSLEQQIKLMESWLHPTVRDAENKIKALKEIRDETVKNQEAASNVKTKQLAKSTGKLAMIAAKGFIKLDFI